jgi:hypothetical protein
MRFILMGKGVMQLNQELLAKVEARTAIANFMFQPGSWDSFWQWILLPRVWKKKRRRKTRSETTQSSVTVGE